MDQFCYWTHFIDVVDVVNVGVGPLALLFEVRFIWFDTIDITKPYKFMWFEAIDMDVDLDMDEAMDLTAAIDKRTKV